MDKLYDEIFNRNIGIFTQSEQDKLKKSRVAVAGAGGIGSLLAERLARLGIGKIKITDPGVIKKSDLNRIIGSNIGNVGLYKAEVISSQIREINPHIQVEYNTIDITNEKDAELFTQGCQVIADEMDFGLFEGSIALQRAARKKGRYYLFAADIGFGALTAVFEPTGITLEEYNKLPRNIPLNMVKDFQVPINSLLPIIPSYTNSQEAVKLIREHLAGKRTIPVTAICTGLASIMAANEVINIILKKRDVTVAPKYTYVDLYDRKFIIGSIR